MAELPELPAMTGAELQATREFLGLSRSWLADKLQIRERRIMRMDADQEPIPPAMVSFLDEVTAETKAIFGDLVARYRREVKADEEPVFFRTYRTDDLYQADVPESKYPSRWHRMLAARLYDAVPGLVISYWDREDQPELFDIRSKTGS